MEIWQVVVLGIVQGASEFLPISSTAHLILLPYFFNWPDLGLSFDVALHLGTLLAVGVFFWGEWWRIIRNKKLLTLLALATIPGIILGYLLESQAESTFRAPLFISFNLVFFGLFLWAVDKWSRKIKDWDKVGKLGALVVGIFQAVAILPGVSRSGATISGGLLFGLTREAAVKFSFLLSAPIILGSVLWEGKKLLNGEVNGAGWDLWLTGIIISGISGYLAIKFLLKFVQRNSFLPFVVYRFILAAVIIFTLLARGSESYKLEVSSYKLKMKEVDLGSRWTGGEAGRKIFLPSPYVSAVLSPLQKTWELAEFRFAEKEISSDSLENLKTVRDLHNQGNYIVFVSNHLTYVDPVYTGFFLNQNGFSDLWDKMDFIVRKSALEDPLFKLLTSTAPMIPVYTSDEIKGMDPKEKKAAIAWNMSALRTSHKRLKSGRMMLEYPEGTRTDGSLQRPEPASAYFWQPLPNDPTEVYVVATAILGTEKIWPRGSSVLHLRPLQPVTYFVNEPIPVSFIKKQAGGAIEKESNVVMKSVADLLPEERRGVYR